MKKVWNFVKVGALALGVIFALNSCKNSNNDQATDEASQTDTTATEQAAPAPKGPTDPQIASIAVTANQNDIEYAKIAVTKATSPEVKKFAQTMINDHQAVIDAAVALANKLGVTPEDNPTTKALLDRKAKDLEMLNSTKKGATFDKAYIDNEVDYHKFAIGAVKDVLIPNAQNAELKSLLESAVPNFETHLEHAEMIQGKLNK